MFSQRKSHHRDNWLVATERSYRRCSVILRCLRIDPLGLRNVQLCQQRDNSVSKTMHFPQGGITIKPIFITILLHRFIKPKPKIYKKGECLERRLLAQSLNHFVQKAYLYLYAEGLSGGVSLFPPINESIANARQGVGRICKIRIKRFWALLLGIFKAKTMHFPWLAQIHVDLGHFWGGSLERF